LEIGELSILDTDGKEIKMNYTPNYSMKLPGYGDNADIADLNENTTAIDGLIHDNRTMIAQAYSQLESYVVGDIVENEGKLYRCIGATSGNWDSAKWTRTTLGDEVEESGASTLADLDDVSLTTPTEGQILTYDGDEWVNADAPDVDVTKTASGNPIEISDSASAPLVKCTTAITGSQDLHGYDKPWVGGAGKNKLHVDATSKYINGVTYTVESDGKIKADGTSLHSPYYAWIHICSNSDFNNLGLVSGQSYILSGNINPTKGLLYIEDTNSEHLYEDTGNGVTFTYNGETNWRIGYVANFQTTFDDEYVVFPMIRLSTVSDATFTPYSNICPITAYTEGEIEMRGKNAAQEPQAKVYSVVDGSSAGASQTYACSFAKVEPNTDYILSWGNHGSVSGLIYYEYFNSDTDFKFISGSQIGDVSTKTFTTPANCTVVCAETGGSQIPITPSTVGFIQIEKGTTATTYEPYSGTSYTATFSNSIYQGEVDFVGGEAETQKILVVYDGTETWIQNESFANTYYTAFPSGVVKDNTKIITNQYEARGSGNIGFMVGGYFNITDPINATSLANWQTYLSNHPLQVVYELENPTTESITPTNLPLKSLFGYNHIESSTGEMEIEYIAKTFSPITEIVDSQISALQKMMELMLTSAREATMTASANYTTGTLIVACGALYKATTAISSGASLVVGTNITPTTIAAELAALA
jgi:hypothetical protein